MIAFPELVYECTIPGKPQPWKRARKGRRGFFKDPRWESYEITACFHMSLALKQLSQRHPARSVYRPLFPEGAVLLSVDAYWPMPGKPRVKVPKPLLWKPTRPDGDNVLKGIADASQGILVADDGQYAEMRVRCFHAGQSRPEPRVEITARLLGNEDLALREESD